MKKYIALLSLCLIGGFASIAQGNVFSVGGTKALTITGGTLFSADSLVLIPAGSFSISSNALTESPVPVPGYPTASIRRVYYLQSPIVFTGSLQLYYQLSELNGNLESGLKYSDSTTGSFWLPSTTSTVNTGAHFVQQAMSGRTLIAATATGPDSILAIRLLWFAGQWDRDHAALEWTVDQNEGIKDFTVQSSLDAMNWTQVSTVAGSLANGQYSYHYDDYGTAFTSKLYRIGISEFSGALNYSAVIRISKADVPDDLYIEARAGGAIIYCKGDGPTALRVMNSIGQMVWASKARASQYELNNLLPGIYFIQYEMSGALHAKQFVVR